LPQYQLPMGPRPIPIIFFDVSTTQGPFTVPNLGGKYCVTVNGTFNGGSVTLEKLSRDGVTGVAVLPAFTANGYAVIGLPSGTYQLAISEATAVYAAIEGVG
jgi:hypothetical protein